MAGVPGQAHADAPLDGRRYRSSSAAALSPIPPGRLPSTRGLPLPYRRRDTADRKGTAMSKVLERLAEAGLTLPEPLKMPPNVVLPFPWVHVRGSRVLVSGHGPQEPDGSLSGPFGQVGGEVGPDAARDLARKTALAMLGSLQRGSATWTASPAGCGSSAW